MRTLPTLAPMLLAALLLSACGKGDSGASKPAAPTVPVTVLAVAPRDWADTLEALGTAQANESVTLTAKITETVRKLGFADGQVVEAGDVLVELTSGQQVAQLEEAQAVLKDAERQYRRQQDLLGQGTVSKALFDTAETTRDSSRARVEAIRAQLADRIVSAPFGGVLGLRKVSPGTLVTPGTPIVTLDDIHVIKLDFAVPETALAALKPGLAVQATSPAFPDRRFAGKVESIDSRVDPATRAVTVRALIPNQDASLRPGMLLTVEVRARERMALAVPELALVPNGNRQFVYRLDDQDIAHLVEVRVGARRAGEVEIVAGLEPGTRVVVEGTVSLRDGAKVAVKTVTANAAPVARQG